MTKNEHLQKFTKARSAMIQSQRFYGSLALRLTPVETDRVETAACDGHRFYFNGAWIEQTSTPEVIGVLAHAVISVANLHHTRRRGRDKKRWNRASDLCVNPILKEAGFQLPADAENDPQFHGLSVEEIYHRLAQDEGDGEGEGKGEGQGQGASSGAAGAPGEGDEAEGEGEGEGEGDDASSGPDSGDEEGEGEGQDEGPNPDDLSGDSGGCGEILDARNEDGSKPSKADISQMEMEQQMAATQARNLAKNAGQGSSDIDRVVDELKKAQVDWVEQLRRWAQQRAKETYTWARPNRRFMSQGIHLPSLSGTGMGEMVIVADMSGSVLEWTQRFLTEIGGIREDLRPEKLHIVYCTDRIEGVDSFDREEEFFPHPRGMGGTNLRAAFRWVENEGIEPACMVVLTDLLTDFDPHEPGYPVLWASTLPGLAPWGETIHLKR